MALPKRAKDKAFLVGLALVRQNEIPGNFHAILYVTVPDFKVKLWLIL